METKLYNIQGKEAGTVQVPEAIFGLPWNADLVHQVVEAMRANARPTVAHTKDRGEVRGGGKKPWQQKGTGRARHGSSRSPIWKGGGVTHGPRKQKIYRQVINRTMRQKALLVALSRKYKDGEVLFLDKLELGAPKAAEAKKILASLATAGFPLKSKNAALVALPSRHAATMKSFRNFSNLSMGSVSDLNPVSVLGAKYLVIADPEAAFLTLGKKRAAQPKAKAKAK
jgi:large subunit ribosomal protein L4